MDAFKKNILKIQYTYRKKHTITEQLDELSKTEHTFSKIKKESVKNT